MLHRIYILHIVAANILCDLIRCKWCVSFVRFFCAAKCDSILQTKSFIIAYKCYKFSEVFFIFTCFAKHIWAIHFRLVRYLSHSFFGWIGFGASSISSSGCLLMLLGYLRSIKQWCASYVSYGAVKVCNLLLRKIQMKRYYTKTKALTHAHTHRIFTEYESIHSSMALNGSSISAYKGTQNEAVVKKIK